MSVVKKRAAGAAGTQNHRTVLKRSNCGTLGEGFGDGRHGNVREHVRLATEPVHGVAKRQRVDDGRQHAHLVADDAVATRGRNRHAANDIAATNNDGDLDARPGQIDNLLGNPVEYRCLDAINLISCQCLAGDLEKNAFIRGSRH